MAIDFISQINDLRTQKRDLLAKAESYSQDGKLDKVGDIATQMEGINNSIDSLEKLAAASKDRAEPVREPTGTGEDSPADDKAATPHLFNSLGEQLQAIRSQAVQHIEDKRLTQINDAVLGANEGTGADGGFAIQTDFAGTIMESAVSMSPLLQKLDRYTCSASSNSAKWLSIAETDVSASVFGGIQMYWSSEAATVGTSKPKFQELKMDLEKMMGFAYVTDELLQDAAFLSGMMTNGFSLAADRLLTAGVIAGDGVGKPTGILNSTALVTVPKETSQTAGTINGTNVVKMMSRGPMRNRERMLWLMHPDAEDQLPSLSITNGTDSKFLWNPEGGLRALDYQTILNKPVVFDDNCSALGSAGDILLIDPMEYILLTKGTARQDWSIHVAFLTDQQCFRVIYRCNGMPKVSSPITLKNSTKTRSPFVTLAARG